MIFRIFFSFLLSAPELVEYTLNTDANGTLQQAQEMYAGTVRINVILASATKRRFPPRPRRHIATEVNQALVFPTSWE